MDVFVTDVENLLLRERTVVLAVLRPDLGQLAVEMDDTRGTRPLVEIVDVLGDDRDIIVFLQIGNGLVRGIGLGILQVPALHVVKIQ